ncbi:MAG: PIN domain-containing protein [Oceanipulchritudo sp.]
MRLFLDANILFSAAKSAGAVRDFLVRLRTLGHTFVVDGYVVGEARRNVEAKFPEAVGDLDRLLADCEIFTELCAPLACAIVPELTEKDHPVLAAALQHRCDALVTGDKVHFGSLYGQKINGVMIHSPAGLAGHLELNS